ncbi:MAG TPA: hypothetical protein VIW28_06500 [Gemmatimonadales bacterium]
MAGARGATGQQLTATELAVGATTVLAHRSFWGVGVGIARRPGGQGRLAVTAWGGDDDGAFGMRVEASAQFLLQPGARSGGSVYGGLGIAFAGGSAHRGAGYLMALLGVEAAPGRTAGWYAELGLAGGVRISGGWRWRRLPSWW